MNFFICLSLIYVILYFKRMLSMFLKIKQMLSMRLNCSAFPHGMRLKNHYKNAEHTLYSITSMHFKALLAC
jgi:hypothetical protein